MNNVLAVQVLDPLAKLGDGCDCEGFGESFSLFENLEEVALRAKLQ